MLHSQGSRVDAGRVSKALQVGGWGAGHHALHDEANQKLGPSNAAVAVVCCCNNAALDPANKPFEIPAADAT
jgi:hypothetical protein